ncbi:ABC transporter substrate-binding protein [Streptomyces sp. NBC_01216]|uniref:ABC transporter substrate-binding protein n=1 Tax=unclassified Streptomyces TaxID=2593676 RepID=UPI002E124A20|nr:ABC transporter substrate-binding protein [Streptomyces sp. NBC_01216]
MPDAGAWGFTDDRGVEVTSARRPERVVAYVRAGAALRDLGVTPAAVYGSGHDGSVLDPVKAGDLEATGVAYLGPGRTLDEEILRALRPDLLVDVTYDGKRAYALDEAVADRLGVPTAVLSVGGEQSLAAIVGRFGELGAALRDADSATPVASAATGPGVVEVSEAALASAAGSTSASVLALSGAGPDQVHLARPRAWPELARLLDLGVRLLDPGPGPGANWLTTEWEYAAGLAPDLILFDSRSNAVRPEVAVSAGDARVAPWNPETPPSPVAYGRFFRDVAAALPA